MSHSALTRLIEGYRTFHETYQSPAYEAYRETASSRQNPRIMMIACSDSRIPPSLLTKAHLGDLFTVRNVANLVPPYAPRSHTYHGVSAALEFAVLHLKVEHIIILGHSGCGGIKALMETQFPLDSDDQSFITSWVGMAQEAKRRVLKQHYNEPPLQKNALCERESLVLSLQNLRTFPWIQEACDTKNLSLHAWHFEIKNGHIDRYNMREDTWIPLIS